MKEQKYMLKEMAAFQKNSIVSQTLIDKPSGTVTLFAFDRDQALSEHTAPYDALVQVIEGQAEITISKKIHRLQEGEVILMPANQPHALWAVTAFKMLLTMIKN